MTDTDPAFLWETEALRSATHRLVEAEVDGHDSAAEGRWVTLREANRQTGIPVETLRKWARRSTIPSYLSPTNRGTSIRMVDLDGVAQRAGELGRTTTPPAGTEQTESSAPAAQTAPTPPGTMIVPVDAWNKMLNQLGNLHEAGRELASARERAAKAETEARFLRERLAELRRAEQPAPPPPPAATDPEPATTAEPPETIGQFILRRRRPG